MLVLALLTPVITTPVYADEPAPATLSDDQRGAISMGCSSIKTSLRQLQRSDSATRAHLGTTYQTILDNYLTPLSVRLVKENQPSAHLNSILTSFSAERQTFTQEFINYSRSFEELLAIDCKSDPDAFYAKLIQTRAARASLARSVSALTKTLGSHKAAVKELKNV